MLLSHAYDPLARLDQINRTDVFAALTACDRYYKPGKSLNEALMILGQMAQKRQIDPDFFDIFVREKIWLRYAQNYLPATQIDAVDLRQIPGYTP